MDRIRGRYRPHDLVRERLISALFYFLTYDMIEINNNELDCKIFTDDIEPSALQQVYDVIKMPEWKGRKVRIMPDVHAGSGICIGFTSDLGDYIDPDYIGVDIGCSVSMMFLDKPIPADQYELFEHRVRKSIPTGDNLQPSRCFDVKEFLAYLRSELQKAYQSTHGLTWIPDFNDEDDLRRWCGTIGMDLATFYKSIGTLGSGNHYLEYDEGNDKYGISVHTGSRNLGVKVNKYWKSVAMNDKVPKDIQREIAEKVRSFPGIDKKDIKNKIDLALKLWKDQNIHLGLLSGENLRGYLTDMVVAMSYASWNHKIIMNRISEIYSKLCGGREISRITTRHNYIDFSGSVPIIRKGAVSAKEGEVFLCPMNMRDGVAVCVGKGNPDTNESAPHGAGRALSRSAAKSKVSMKDFEKSMKGIYSTSVCKETLDESPQAYKPMGEILENIKPCADVQYILKPKINIKAIK